MAMCPPAWRRFADRAGDRRESAKVCARGVLEIDQHGKVEIDGSQRRSKDIDEPGIQLADAIDHDGRLVPIA